MSFRRWLRQISSILLGSSKRSARKHPRTKLRGQQVRQLGLEFLEERIAPATYQWIGGGTGATATNWDNAANWKLLTGTGATFPNAPGDIAQFTSSAAPQTMATVDVPITVGEIDFGSIQNYTISASAGNVLKLDQGLALNSVLSLGTVGTNTGTDLISAPLQAATESPVTATITGGTLQLTNTNTGATANLFTSASLFTVNTGATLRESAVGTGSQVTANLVDTGALSTATLSLAGGNFIIDPTASTAANGLATKYITTPQQIDVLATYDFLNSPPTTPTPPTFQTAGFGNMTANLNSTFSFSAPAQTSVWYAGQSSTYQFGVRFTGLINITQAGPTTFQTGSDDGTRVYIDGNLVVNNDGPHGVVLNSATVNLTAGLHNIQVDYVQGGGGDSIQVYYAPAGGTLQPIPFSALYTPDNLALPNAVTVSGNSSITLNGANFTTVSLGALTFNNLTAPASLTVNGQAGKKLTFASTTSTTNTTNSITLNDTADVALSTNTPVQGSVTLAANLIKQGTGKLFLDNSSAATPNSIGNVRSVVAAGATEVGTTATLTTTAANTFVIGQQIVVAGVTDGSGNLIPGYIGTFTVTGKTATTVSYTTTAGLGNGIDGTITAVPNTIVNGATESGNTVTITTTAANTLVSGQFVNVSGVATSGYNGTWQINSVSGNTFTYVDPTLGLADSGGGSVTSSTFTIVAGATESGTTATITTAGLNTYSVGEKVTIAGVGVAGYNGTKTITAVGANTFSFTAASSGLGNSGGGTATPTAAMTTLSDDGAGNITVTTATPVNVAINHTITVTGVATQTQFNGTWTVTSVISPTSFVYYIGFANSHGVASDTTGTVTGIPDTIVDGATESGTTATITTTAPHNYVFGQQVTVAGVNVAGYNGTVTITGTTANSFSYTAAAGLANGDGGTTAGPTFNIAAGASETGTTATITTATAHGYVVGQRVTVSGVVDGSGSPIAGYNGTFTITSQTANTFSYTTVGGLGIGNDGTTSGPTFNVFAGATEVGTTVTITTTAPHLLTVGETITIAGMANPGYNGSFTVLSVLSPTSFTYTNSTTGLTDSTGGTVTGSNPATLDIQGGKVVAVGSGVVGASNPLGSAAVTIDGSGGNVGTLALDSAAPALLGASATVAIGSASESGNTVTLNTSNQSFSPGQAVLVTGITPGGYNGVYTILTASSNQITYTDSTAANLASSTVAGAVTETAYATFNNNITATASGTIEAVQAAALMTLGGNINVTSGNTLTFGSYSGGTNVTIGSTLAVSGAVSGSGSVTTKNTSLGTNTTDPGTVLLNNPTPVSFIVPTTQTITTASPFGGAQNLIIPNGVVLTVTETANGGLANVSSITVNTGGSLIINDTAAGVTNTLGASTAINLDGGAVSIIGNATAGTNTTESFGAINDNAGASSFTTTKGAGGTLTITAASLSGTAGATVDFRDTSATFNVTATPTSTNGILTTGASSWRAGLCDVYGARHLLRLRVLHRGCLGCLCRLYGNQPRRPRCRYGDCQAHGE